MSAHALILGIISGFSMFLIGRWLGHFEGKRPLTKLKPGAYEVRAVVYASKERTLLVIRRPHMDRDGVFRMVDLENRHLIGQPFPGDMLVAAPPPWGSTIFYEVRER